ncbi:MAG: hypothetical protein II590_07595 [Clostridia bacterium]|nr:hypothetical protein [Clostridia bacterium]
MENSVFRRILDSETFNDRIIVTVLLGNGFDLSCGLKTRYTNIYDEYINTPSANDNIKIYKISISNCDTWADYEWAMRDHMAEFKSGEDFLECHRDFRDFMTEYLKKQEAAFNEMLDNKAACRKADTEIHDSLERICTELGIGSIESCEWRFITFNYTNTADRLLGKYGPVIHIHGTLDDSPVSGINDATQFPSGLAYPITEEIKTAFVKPVFNDEYKPDLNQKVERIIASSNHIVAFGLSFGETDKKWLGAVLNRLAELSSADLHVFDYKCMKSYAKHGDTKISAQKKAKKQLIEKTLIPNAPEWARVSFPCVKPLFDIGPIFARFTASNQKRDRFFMRYATFTGIIAVVFGIIMSVLYFSQSISERQSFLIIGSLAAITYSFYFLANVFFKNDKILGTISILSGIISFALGLISIYLYFKKGDSVSLVLSVLLLLGGILDVILSYLIIRNTKAS